MHRAPAKGSIRPKISTMPRQKSEAATVLNIYKLLVEKKRLQEELENIDERRQQILQRLAVLEQHVSILESDAAKMREGVSGDQSSAEKSPQPLTSMPGNFETLFLEY
jgi:chromosome segregation ATPase